MKRSIVSSLLIGGFVLGCQSETNDLVRFPEAYQPNLPVLNPDIVTPKELPKFDPSTLLATSPIEINPSDITLDGTVFPEITVVNPSIVNQCSTDDFKTQVYRPKLDILFYIDDSKSMEAHIARLSNQIDQFVKAVGQYSVDLHVGVITPYDSARFTPDEDAFDGTLSEAYIQKFVSSIMPVSATDLNGSIWRESVSELRILNARNRSEPQRGQRNFRRSGRLVELRGLSDSERTRLNHPANHNYFTSQMSLDVLKQTLRVPIQTHDPRNLFDASGNLVRDAVGVEHEEVLYPVLSALMLKDLVSLPAGETGDYFRAQHPHKINGSINWERYIEQHNPGFRRDDAQLAIFVVSDTVEMADVNAHFKKTYNELKGAVRPVDYRISETAQTPAINSVDSVLASVMDLNEVGEKRSANSGAMVASLLKAYATRGGLGRLTTVGVLHPRTFSKELTNSLTASSMPANCDADYMVDHMLKDSGKSSYKSFDEALALEDFFNKTSGEKGLGGNIISICSSNYGAKLAEIGAELKAKAFGVAEIPLNRKPADPVSQNITVQYAGESIKPYNPGGKNDSAFWMYDDLTARVRIFNLHKIRVESSANARLGVCLSRVFDPNQNNSANSTVIGRGKN